MHSYEYRIFKGNQPWRQCDRDEALASLTNYGTEAETILKRIDAGETISGVTFQIRRFDSSTAPLPNRPEIQPDDHGDYLYA